jgi:DNA-binding IclR family transcriptional regulator
MELLTKEPFGLTLSEVSSKLGIPVSSTFEILHSLVECRMLSLSCKRYRIGLKLFELSQSINRDFFLLQCARPYILEIRDSLKNTIHFAALDRTDVVYLSKLNFSQENASRAKVGLRLPAHLTGLGKAMLSKLSDEEIRRYYVDYDFKMVTKKSTTNVDQLLSKLAQTRKDGYAIDSGEYLENLYCVAVTIDTKYSDMNMALSCSIKDTADVGVKLPEILKELKNEAENISRSISYFYENKN